jgi:hypothetical protein
VRFAVLVVWCGISAQGADGAPSALGIFSVDSYADGAPFVARVLAESASEVKLAPAAGGEAFAVPAGTVRRWEADKEPLRAYIANYEALLDCRWVTAAGKNRPTVGRMRGELAVLLGAKGQWEESAPPEGGLVWGDPLTGGEVETILGPVPALEKEAAAPGAEKAVCARCQDKGEIECPQCERGKVKTSCPRCHGEGYERCVKCNGTGGTPCPACKGTGNVRQYRFNGQVSFGKCERCGGRGRLTCGSCSGKGRDSCTLCNGACRVTEVCTRCKGTHKIPCPRCKAAAARGEEAALPSSLRQGQGIAYARVLECGAAGAARAAGARLADGLAAIDSVLGVSRATAALFKKRMQSQEAPEFRKTLIRTRKTEYQEIMTLYQREVTLQADLETIAKSAARLQEGLLPEALAAATVDTVFGRVQSARETVVRGGSKTTRLQETSGALRAALESEWAAYGAQLKRENESRAYEENIAVALEDLGNVKVLGAAKDEGALGIRITSRKDVDVASTLQAVAGRVFSEFDDIVRISVAGRDGAAITREEWEEAREAAASTDEDAPAAAVAVATAEEKPGSGNAFVMVLCGGVALSFVLLAVMVVRSRKGDERYSWE